MERFEDLLVAKDELTLEDVEKIVNYKFDDLDEKMYQFRMVDYTYDLNASGELFEEGSGEISNEDDNEDECNWYISYDYENFSCADEDDINNIINNIIDELYGLARDNEKLKKSTK